MKKLKKHIVTGLLWLVLIAGLCLVLYPTVSDTWNSYHQTRAIAKYTEAVADLDTGVYAQMRAEAQAFNAEVAARENQWFMSKETTEQYNSLLNISGTGIMGYIDIPKIKCSLPIYHGTSEGVLQIAVGHIEGSSLPVGGAGTHTVLSGHCGLPSARLFTDLDRLVVGDTFTLTVLDEILTYRVDQIRIVLPEEVAGITVEPGQDYCTLITCTPYGVNTHRLLVRGTRTETVQAAITISEDAMRIEPLLLAPIVAAPALFVLLLWALLSPPPKQKKKLTLEELELPAEDPGE